MNAYKMFKQCASVSDHNDTLRSRYC